MKRILWLAGGNISAAQKNLQTKLLKNYGVPAGNIFYHAPSGKLGALSITKSGKSVAQMHKREQFQEYLRELIKIANADIIVSQDFGVTAMITGKSISLDQQRGSVYQFDGLPVLITFPGYYMHKSPDQGFVISHDLLKLQRWFNDDQRVEPKFGYKVCRTIEDVKQFERDALNSITIGIDLETAATAISCIQYACLKKDGEIFTWVVPFMNPTKDNACHWDTEAEEIEVWSVVRRVNALSCPKAFHNGMYDNTYLMIYRAPVVNYTLDSMYMMHSIWVETKRSLAKTSAICIDHCRFWKDEMKGDKKTKHAADRVPDNEYELEMYWRYGALDSYNTVLNVIQLTKIILQLSWAMENYRTRMQLTIGPALRAQMTGLLIDSNRHNLVSKEWEAKAEKALRDVRTVVDDPEYNPRSPVQYASYLYDVLGAQPVGAKKSKTKKGNNRSTDEKMLKRIKLQHPIIKRAIEYHEAYLKPAADFSKYGHMHSLGKHGRFLYSLNPSGTDTSRFASSNHALWVGTNAQNIPERNRDMFIADPDYVLFEPDYSQSDSYYVAYTSGDEHMIEVLTDDNDTHCTHAAFFFKQDYDKIYQGYKDKADWVVHPTLGVRQNTKRVTHGANYDMQGETLFYQSMGREEVIGAGKALGYEDCHKWSDKQLIAHVCTPLLAQYNDMYPGLQKYKDKLLTQVAQRGNIFTATHGFTRIFTGNLLKDAQLQRKLFAFVGQGGTSGAVNVAIKKLFWDRQIHERLRCYFLSQTHDSILTAIHKDDLHEAANEIISVMTEEFDITDINGTTRTLHVPVDPKVGLSWGGNMGKFTDSITFDDIVKSELEWEKAKYAEMEDYRSDSAWWHRYGRHL